MSGKLVTMSIDALLQLANEKYVSLTTFRKNGQGVATPLWCARDGDQLVSTTGADSWKIKRIRNNNIVEVVECDARGTVTSDASPIRARASVFTDQPTLDRVEALLKDKYGFAHRVITWTHKFQKHAANRAVIVLTLVEAE